MGVMLPLLLLGAAHAPASPFDFRYEWGSGLTVVANGLPLVQGSGCQVHAPGWTRGFFSSSSGQQTVDRPDTDTLVVHYRSGATDGTVTYHRDGTVLHVDETYQWNGDEPAEVEITAAKFWAPALAVADFTANGKAMPRLDKLPDSKASMGERQVAPNGSELKFKGPWGTMTVLPRDTPWFTFDARGYPQEYAVGKSLIWFGVLGAPLPKGKPVHFGFDLKIDTATAEGSGPLGVEPGATRMLAAESALDETLPMAPNPKRPVLTRELVEIGGPFSFPAGRFFHFDDFKQAVSQRFAVTWPVSGAPALVVDGGIHDMKLPHEGFRLTIRKDGFTVFGQDELGLRIGLRRLALLVRSQGGKLFLPVGQITDWPSTPWRGVHLFAGPASAPFQRELIEKVLIPFGFNKEVIECERAAWASTPNVRGGDTMSVAAVRDLFKMVRKEGLEPIPLVQSFGHMEWFFQGGGNLDIAYNPSNPYGVDPRKPRTKEALGKLWDEVLDVTEAKTIHFGCDEVDMIGWDPNPTLMTDLWKQQMPVLGDIAKKHGVGMMLWGDMALAPGQAIDATNGVNGTESAERRGAIPPGAMIADWHYKADTKFEHFFPSLDQWKADKHPAIASCWHEPDNVYGFTVAGVQQGAGILKTTWCGYTSKASDAATNFDEFAAMLLAGEYAWSGRQDAPSELAYDYRDLFRKLYFEAPMPLQPVPGTGLKLGKGEAFSIGRYNFAPFKPLHLHSSLVESNDPSALELHARMTASTVVIACGCAMSGDTGAEVAKVTVKLEDGSTVERTLHYGEDLRSTANPGVTPLAEQADGKFAALVRLPKPRSSIVGITITPANSYSGFTLYGVTGL